MEYAIEEHPKSDPEAAAQASRRNSRARAQLANMSSGGSEGILANISGGGSEGEAAASPEQGVGCGNVQEVCADA